MTSCPVALLPCVSYEEPWLTVHVCEVLDASGWTPARGDKVLLKPNLLRAVPLACTHPLVVKAAASWLLDRGVRVTVADSPGFGTAQGVAEAIGLDAALKPLGLRIQEMGAAVNIGIGEGRLDRKVHWGVSRLALESDALLSVPRVKAHGMMRITLAVKNLFGTVCGLRKAWAHSSEGESTEAFARCILELYHSLPPSAALVDGVEAMHITGPARGQAYALGVLAASADAQAADCALYQLLQLKPQDIPLWNCALQRGAAQAMPENLSFPLSRPEDFGCEGFILPQRLDDVSFKPHRLFLSLCRRIWYSITG